LEGETEMHSEETWEAAVAMARPIVHACFGHSKQKEGKKERKKERKKSFKKSRGRKKEGKKLKIR
jgi:hypothetical protein